MKPSLLSFKTRCFSKIGIIFCKTNALSQSKVQCSSYSLTKQNKLTQAKRKGESRRASFRKLVSCLQKTNALSLKGSAQFILLNKTD